MPREPKPKAEFKGHSLQHRKHEFLSGIPARDLTDEDFDALTDEQQAQVVASDLYKVRDDPVPAAKAEPKKEAS